jgi:hypothetical protein
MHTDRPPGGSHGPAGLSLVPARRGRGGEGHEGEMVVWDLATDSLPSCGRPFGT